MFVLITYTPAEAALAGAFVAVFAWVVFALVQIARVTWRARRALRES